LLRGVNVVRERFQLAGHDDRGDEPVNGDRLAKDDGDQVLGLDAWCFHAAANNAHARRVYSQRGTDDGQRYRERYAQHGPHVRRRVGQEPSDADLLTFAGQQVEQYDERY